ncbi:Crp/Fnr family transcriptional regulator [marine bacterium AO1-C]|nr:Crp/Fnr family transcriptional regulator [marine bacterium AO1-C]
MANDFEKILAYTQKFIAFNDEERAFYESLMQVKKLRKKQTIVQPGYVCKHRTYVLEGTMRSFLYDNNAHEHTIALAVEDWWISDFNSYIYQIPSTLFVEAMEKTTVIQMDFESEQLLLERYPKFEKFFRILYQRSVASLQRRMLSNLSKTAEERYEEFMERYPHIANRIPQYVLASYLGFSNEYLSRIRNKRTKR